VPIDDLAFEHRMYLPLAGLVTLIVIGGYVLLERLQGWLNVPEGKASAARTVACVVVVALAATLVGRTRVRNLDYRTKLTIWQDSAAKSPHSARSHFSVGGALGEIADAIQRMVEERKALAGQMHGMGQEASARTAKKEAKDWLEKARAALREAEKFNLRAVELAPKNTEAR